MEGNKTFAELVESVLNKKNKTIEELSDKIIELEAKVENLQTSNYQAEYFITDFQRRNRIMRNNLKKKQKQIDEKDEIIFKKTQEINELKEEHNEFVNSMTQIEGAMRQVWTELIATRNQRIEYLECVVEEVAVENERIKAQLEEAADVLETLAENSLEEVLEENQKLSEKLEEAKLKIEHFQSKEEKRKLKASKSVEKNKADIHRRVAEFYSTIKWENKPIVIEEMSVLVNSKEKQRLMIVCPECSEKIAITRRMKVTTKKDQQEVNDIRFYKRHIIASHQIV